MMFHSRRFWKSLKIALLAGLTLPAGYLPLAAEPEAPFTGQGEVVSVVTWNIEWFPGRSPRANESQQEAHRAEVAEYVPGLGADILLLQEIRDEEAAQFIVDQLPGLELNVVSRFVRPNPLISQQVVIASRFPALAGFMELFRGPGYDREEGDPYRGFAFAALESPWGGTLLVYSVHLKSNRGDAGVNIPMRESAARQILAHIAEMTEEYASRGEVQVIVGGDFNVILDRPEGGGEETIDLFLAEGFRSTWEGVPFADRVTWPARGRFGDASFDYILTFNLPEVTASLIYKPQFELSDHRPVRIDLPLPAAD